MKNKKLVDELLLNFWAPYMGSAQRLNNGNWLVGCGSSEECTARIIDIEGNILWNMTADAPYKMFRAYFYESLK